MNPNSLISFVKRYPQTKHLDYDAKLCNKFHEKMDFGTLPECWDCLATPQQAVREACFLARAGIDFENLQKLLEPIFCSPGAKLQGKILGLLDHRTHESVEPEVKLAKARFFREAVVKAESAFDHTKKHGGRNKIRLVLWPSRS